MYGLIGLDYNADQILGTKSANCNKDF